MEIIAITGTKGKTTVTRLTEYVLRHMQPRATLRVDTDGHYLNGRQKSTNQDSLDMKNMAATVCPGRYLLDLYRKDREGVAVLECALGCGHSVGMGFRAHDIGVFTNVYEDHINGRNLKHRRDLFRLKDFIIKRVAKNGTLVANCDDDLIARGVLKLLPADSYLLPFGRTFKYFDTQAFLAQPGRRLITCEGNFLVLKDRRRTVRLVDYTRIGITYAGRYLPSVYNLMAAYGALLVFFRYDLKRLPEINRWVEKFAMDKYGARLVNIPARDRTVIIDFAHEKESLREIAGLGRQLGTRVVGVLRLAPDRTDAKIRETGMSLADCYDKVVIYDKVDGITKKFYRDRRISRQPGEVSRLLAAGFRAGGKRAGDVERIIAEPDAIRRAAELSQPGDVVIVISGDDHRATYESVRKFFSE